MDDRVAEPGRVSTSAEIRIPLARAWEVLADANRLGSLLGLRFGGAFSPGARVAVLEDGAGGQTAPDITSTTGEALVEKFEPPHALALRWRRRLPGSTDVEPRENFLVEFTVAETRSGVSLTISESGYDANPAEASTRAEGFVYWLGRLQRIRKALEDGR